MNRRHFIKTLGLGATTTLIAPSHMYATLGNETEDISYALNELATNGVDPIVPFRFFHNRKKYMLEQMIKMRNEYGLRRFLITAPGNEVHFTGYPKPETFEEIGNLILEIKNELINQDIEIGWWCAPALRLGKGSVFQHIVDLNGRVSETTPCPFDPDFQESFSNDIATVVRIARPGIVQFEDDYLLSADPNQGIEFGCFCPRHLEAFAKIQNKYYSREELFDIFQTVTEDSIRLRKDWAELSKNSLVEFPKMVRKKIDAIAPETRVSFTTTMRMDIDGDCVEAVAQAFAGSTKPLLRLWTTYYSNPDALYIPETTFQTLHKRQHLPDHFECICEGDTYPHTTFFMSANKLKSLIATTLSYGLDDVLLYCTQYLDNPIEDKAYVEMYKENKKWFDTLKKETRNCNVVGCEPIYRPDAHTVVPYVHNWTESPWNDWVKVFGKFGIPHTSKEGDIKAVSGNIAKVFNDEELKELFKGALLLDGAAANILYERGWGKYLGVVIKPRTVMNFCFEGVTDVNNLNNIEGDLMYNWAYSPAGQEGSAIYELEVIDSKVEILTNFLNEKEEPVIPGFVRYENELGGRVAIIAYDLKRNLTSSSIFNYKKKEILRQSLEWLSQKQLPIFIKNNPNVFCILNKSLTEKYAIATITSLVADSYDSLSIDIDSELKNARIEILEQSGKWSAAKIKKQKNGITLCQKISYMSPIILKFIL